MFRLYFCTAGSLESLMSLNVAAVIFVKHQAVYIVFVYVLPVILSFLSKTITFFILLFLFFFSFCYFFLPYRSSLPPSSPLTAGLPCINAVPETGCQTKSCFVSSLATAVWWWPTAYDIGTKEKSPGVTSDQGDKSFLMFRCTQPYVLHAFVLIYINMMPSWKYDDWK